MLTEGKTSGNISLLSVAGHTTWGYSSAGRALEWHSRGQRFDPAYLHQKPSISFGIDGFSILSSLFCAGRFHLGQQMDNRPSQFLFFFLLWEGRSYGICQRRNNHAGLPFPGSPAFFYSRYFSASSCGRWPPAGRLFMPEVGLFKLRRICYTKYLGKTFALRGVR